MSSLAACRPLVNLGALCDHKDRFANHEKAILAKYAILGRLERSQIEGAVPPDFRARVLHAPIPAGIYTVVLFEHNRPRGVVTSAHAHRALRRIPGGDAVVAVGTDFTAEASAVLAARGAHIVRIGEFGWTDESYHSLPR